MSTKSFSFRYYKMHPLFMQCFGFVLFFVLIRGDISAQNIQHRCGTAELHRAYLSANPGVQAVEDRTEMNYREYLRNKPPGPSTRAVKTIPLVVHIVQYNPLEYITDADVHNQVEVLNEDFRKMVGTLGDGNGVDTEYEFCLASIDTNGCPTSGINRIVDADLAGHLYPDDESALKAAIQWDPNRYCNIWVPASIFNLGPGTVAGYARMPSSILMNPELDGIVIHGDFFSRNRDALNLGRIATHEMGHYMGLDHTFEGGCLAAGVPCNTGGDRVCDTPQAMAPNYGCPSGVNSCVDFPVDEPDLIENYMDYSHGSCQNMFTAGQKDRMDVMMNTYRSGMYSANNLGLTGCDGSVSPGCAPVANFSTDVTGLCVGQTVTFTDLSYGPATTWQWSFPGGTPSTSSVPNPQVTYNTPGTYAVSLNVTNAAGSSGLTSPLMIEVAAPTGLPILESFEGLTPLPFGWYTRDEDEIGTWTRTNLASSDGNTAMYIDNYYAPSLGADDLVSASFDLGSLSNPTLIWDRAYRRINPFRVDSLLIDISTDCGESWTNEWLGVAGSLISVGGTPTTPFVPTSSEWKTDTLSLGVYAGANELRLRFRFNSGNGQNIYLDHLRIEDVLVGLEEEFDREAAFSVVNPWNESLVCHGRSGAGQLHTLGFTRQAIVQPR